MTRKKKGPSAKDADVVFSYEDYESPGMACRDYLGELPTTGESENSLRCNELVILTKSVGIIRQTKKSSLFPRGTVICKYAARGGLDPLCSPDLEPVELLSDNRLKSSCKRSSAEIIL